MIPPEAVIQRCSVKKVFLEISQNSQENRVKATATASIGCEFQQKANNS